MSGIEKRLAARLCQFVGHKIQASVASGPSRRGRGYGSGGAKWRGGLSGDGRGLRLDHQRLRTNTRTAVNENLVARAITERYADNVAGPGVRFAPAPLARILGVSEQRAEAWGQETGERFHIWAESKQACRSEDMNFYQSHRFYAFSQQRDNDNFVRLYYSNNPELMNPLQFSFLDPDQIPGPTFPRPRLSKNDKRIEGVVRDSGGKAISYNIKVRGPDGKLKIVPVPAQGRRSGRTMILHGFSPEYAGQSRGYPRLSHALQEMQNLTDFSSAQIMKAINQSQFFMFVKPSNDAPASNILKDVLDLDDSQPAGAASLEFGGDPQPSGDAQNVTEESLSPVSSFDLPSVDFTVPGSHAVMNLEAGEELKPFVNTAPSESFDKFVDSFTAYLAAASSIPIEILLQRFNENYSASRAALILFWRIALIWRYEMIVDFLNPVYAAWLAEEIGAGRIAAPGWRDPVMRAAWLHGNWHGSPIPSIDPLREAKADMLNVEMAAQTLDAVARKLNGSSGSANRAQLTREFQELATPPWNRSSEAN